MAEAFELLRTVRQHLRRSATLLDQGKLDEAMAETDAALAVDPQSVAAQALRERIVAAQTAVVGPAPAVPAADAPRAFVPYGVDAASWRGFEERITERRFKALLETINTSIAAGDSFAARAALEEARELRPQAAVLATLEARIAAMPMPSAAPAIPAARIWMRAMGAAALFLLGVSLLLGLEWMRPTTGATVVPVAPAAAPELPAVVPTNEVGPAPTPDLAAVPVALNDEDESVPAIVTPPEPLLAPTATSGSTVLAPIPERSTATQQIASSRPPRVVDSEALREEPPRGPTAEVPDEFVVPRTAAVVPDAGPAIVTSAPAADTPITADARNVTTPPPAAMASAITVPASLDQQIRVEEALRRYSRAYGQLDASAAHAVYPAVDERALARAFQNLSSQRVTFDTCDIDITGAVANASCRGRQSYAPKVGNREPRTEERTWRFELRREGDGWTIAGVDVRRAPGN